MKSLYEIQVSNRQFYNGYTVLIGNRPLARLSCKELEIKVNLYLGK